jgi:predicted nucleotidyltransferase
MSVQNTEGIVMDVSHPIRAVVPTLDGPVLEVLAGTTRPLTGPEIQRLAGVGSPNGVRRVLTRLAEQGIVRANQHSAATFYSANREHLAWPAIEELVGIRRALFERIEHLIAGWEAAPLHASLYGSMARAGGDSGSDIDILLVRPQGIDEEDPPWAEQIDELRHKVTDWTGNHCHAFQLDLERLAQHVKADDPLVQEWIRDARTLAGASFKALVGQLPAGGRS